MEPSAETDLRAFFSSLAAFFSFVVLAGSFFFSLRGSWALAIVVGFRGEFVQDKALPGMEADLQTRAADQNPKLRHIGQVPFLQKLQMMGLMPGQHVG